MSLAVSSQCHAHQAFPEGRNLMLICLNNARRVHLLVVLMDEPIRPRLRDYSISQIRFIRRGVASRCLPAKEVTQRLVRFQRASRGEWKHSSVCQCLAHTPTVVIICIALKSTVMLNQSLREDTSPSNLQGLGMFVEPLGYSCMAG